MMSLTPPPPPRPLYFEGFLDPISINGVANCSSFSTSSLVSRICELAARLDQIQAVINQIHQWNHAQPAHPLAAPMSEPPQPMRLHDTGFLNPISMNGLCNLVNYGRMSVASYIVDFSNHLDQIGASALGIERVTNPTVKLLK